MAADGVVGLLVSDEDIKRGVYREIVSQSIAKRQARNQRIIFETFRSLYTQAKKYQAIAYQHQFKKYAGRCFYSWSDWTYQIGTGLERKRWAGPRKYEVNLLLVLIVLIYPFYSYCSFSLLLLFFSPLLPSLSPLLLSLLLPSFPPPPFSLSLSLPIILGEIQSKIS